jgi:hypothetical protein
MPPGLGLRVGLLAGGMRTEAAIETEVPAGRHRNPRRLLVLAGVATVLFDAAILLIDRGLEATGGPSILSLEFAGNLQRVEEISAEWGGHGIFLARLSLWIDFGFMVSYGAFFALAALAIRDFARERNLRFLATVGRIAPFAAVAAAVFDAAENITWLLLLGGRGGDMAAGFGTVCASLKFLLIGLAILYAISGLVVWLWCRYRKL